MDTHATETDPRRPEVDARAARRGLLAVWLVLIGLTGGSFWLGEVRAAPGAPTATLVLSIALVKAILVAGVYMELRAAPRVWAITMAGSLLALTMLLLALFQHTRA